jgi:endonuclease YncB( thermonuclease family)
VAVPRVLRATRTTPYVKSLSLSPGPVVAMCRAILILAVAIACAVLHPAAARDIESYAVVREDGSMIVRGRVIYLFGIHIPDDSQFCTGNIRPALCGTRAAVALDQKIQEFVRCRPIERFADGSLSAQCWTNYSKFKEGEDLALWLIGQGLALATPDAPYAYHAQERIALVNRRGLWGFQVDGIFLPGR